MKKNKGTLYKFIFFNMTALLYAGIFLIGFGILVLAEYVYPLDPFFIIIFYGIWALLDRWITKKCMLSSAMIRWILSFGR